MKKASIFWLVFLAAGFFMIGGKLIYALGRDSALRECPPVQSGERLLNSEQRPDGTVCVYTAAAAAYGQTTLARRP
jgi:hypothetical protein